LKVQDEFSFTVCIITKFGKVPDFVSRECQAKGYNKQKRAKRARLVTWDTKEEKRQAMHLTRYLPSSLDFPSISIFKTKKI
jgi:hypothetical protein